MSMAFSTFKHLFCFALVLALAAIPIVTAGDEDIISDFIVPPNFTIDDSYFTLTSLSAVVGARPPTTFNVSKASLAEFPALAGQSVSYAVLQYPAGSINPPHTHPCSAELLSLLGGAMEVGFIDTTNKRLTQVLQAGDLFVFPKGLVHYQFNSDANSSAFAISAFGSANAGTVSVPTTAFTTCIDDAILAKSFKTDVATIQKLKAGLALNA